MEFDVGGFPSCIAAAAVLALSLARPVAVTTRRRLRRLRFPDRPARRCEQEGAVAAVASAAAIMVPGAGAGAAAWGL
ncbi:UNVERIFIED_CONTAM: hypothetical protein K2H54_022727 [Gekko kuhli]